MLNRFDGLSKSLLGLLLLLVTLQQAHTALPAAVNGQPMPSLAPMLEKATPAVVNIATRGAVRVQSNPLFQDPFFRRFFDIPDQPRERQTQSLGSGVIVDAKQGYIVTNHHVIENANKIEVTLNDGRRFFAKLRGSDPLADMAVIQIQASQLTQIPWSNSDTLRVGDFVVAIGNPFGLGQTVTSGIVSALSRSGLGIEDYEDFIQTDASINPGNSGGALVNLRGELVGINTAILGPSGGNVGIGFAIPANMAKQIMQQLIDYGEVRRGRLGISVQDLSADLAQSLSITAPQGVIVTEIEADSAAEKAGLKVGDVITMLENRRVTSVNDIRNIIGLLRVGEQVNLQIIRDGRAVIIRAEIQERSKTLANGEQISPYLVGAEFAFHEEKDRYQTIAYVYVQHVDKRSPAWEAGLREKDIILSINRKRVQDLDDLLRLAANEPELLLNIQRGQRAFFILLR